MANATQINEKNATTNKQTKAKAKEFRDYILGKWPFDCSSIMIQTQFTDPIRMICVFLHNMNFHDENCALAKPKLKK